MFCRGTQTMDNITAGFVTICCFMRMVSKTLRSHFSSQGSYYGYTHTWTKLHNEIISWISETSDKPTYTCVLQCSSTNVGLVQVHPAQLKPVMAKPISAKKKNKKTFSILATKFYPCLCNKAHPLYWESWMEAYESIFGEISNFVFSAHRQMMFLVLVMTYFV